MIKKTIDQTEDLLFNPADKADLLDAFTARNFTDNWTWMNNGASIIEAAKFRHESRYPLKNGVYRMLNRAHGIHAMVLT